MARLAPVTRKALVKRLNALGFEGPAARSKDSIMWRDDVTVLIPNDHHEALSVGLLARILRQAGVSREEWLGGE